MRWRSVAWTAIACGDHVRPGGTWASDATDREWALIALLLPAVKPRPDTLAIRMSARRP